MSDNVPMFGGIDAGGTTFKCGLADSAGLWIAQKRVPVTTPEVTLAGCEAFFAGAAAGRRLRALGVASFGPIDVDPTSEAYGTLGLTPKPGWSGTALRRFFQQALQTDVHVDSDVNGALLAEMTSGAATGVRSAAYITVGTGIGAGIFLNGDFAGRPGHPEFGHIRVRRHSDDADFAGNCTFHHDCLEGLASVTAVRARWGEPAAMPEQHPGWLIIADYLAQACCVLTLTLRLERIVLGGGLMLAPHLLGRVREAYDGQMAGYLRGVAPSGAELIHRPGLGDDAGLTGALLLAMRA